MEWGLVSAWVITALALFLGSWLQTALGFGMAVLAAPIVVLVKPSWVPYVLTWAALVVSILNAWSLRHHIQFMKMLPAVVSRIPGTILGAWALLFLPVIWLQGFVAICVLIAVLISSFAFRFEATSARLGWAGFISGFMGTTTSIGGPPMALVMQHGKPDVVRANLSIYFTYSCVLSLLSYFVSNQLNYELFIVCASISPCVLLGVFVGLKTRAYITKKHFRVLMLSACGLASIISIVGVFWRSYISQ